MLDINNREITEGAYIQITGCKVKNDNGIYIVDKKYDNREEYCLLKVKQDGTQAKTKYNIYFLNERNDMEKRVTMVNREDLKKAAQEVKAFLSGVTASEIMYTFSNANNQTLEGLQVGQAIKFVKRVQWRGHMNSQSGTYIIKKIENGGYRLHLLGAKGGEIADNANGYYQFTPIHLNLKADTMKQLFDESYIVVLDRHETTKGEQAQKETEQNTSQANVQEVQPVEGMPEQKKEIASLCAGCKNYNVNCEGMEAVYTGCVCYNKDATLPTIKI